MNPGKHVTSKKQCSTFVGLHSRAREFRLKGDLLERLRRVSAGFRM